MMSNSPYTPQEFEARTREGVVNIAQQFVKACRKTAIQNIGIAVISFAAAGYSAAKVPTIALPVSTLGGLGAVLMVRKSRKQMRSAFTEIVDAVPQQASGIVRHELRDLEKSINAGKLDFSFDDIDPRKNNNVFKYGLTIMTGLFIPAFMPLQYMVMLAGDDIAKLRETDRQGNEASKRNQPPAPQQS